MPKTYTRQSSGEIVDGSVIQASDFNDEFNRLADAFSTASGNGHTHDGTNGEGGPITTLGPNHNDVTVSATAIRPTASSNAVTLGANASGQRFHGLFLDDDKKATFGAGADGTIEYDEDGSDTLLIAGSANVRIGNTNNKLEFRDSALSVSSSADGQLDVDADTEVEIVAPTIDLQASTAITLASDAITFGEAGDTDIVLTFNANTADGVLTWMEDEDHFKFSDDVVIDGTEKLYFNDAGGEHIAGDADNLTISAGTDINLTATADVNIPSGVGLSFASDDAEKIESDGTNLTVNSGGDINLTATADVNIPANVGVTFGDDGEKIEGDGTNLTISSSGTATLSTSEVIASDDVSLKSDGAILAFGADKEIKVTHVADRGLKVTNANDDALAGPTITLGRISASAADNDYVGDIVFQADSDGQTTRTVGKVAVQMKDVSDGSEDSDLVLSNIVAGSETAQITLSSDGVTINQELDVDNLNLNGNTISSTDTNGNITLSPNGTGTVVVGTDLDVDNININGNAITSTNTDGDITITPNGNGKVVLDGINFPIADGSTDQFLKTNGSGQLSFATVATDLAGDSSPQLGGMLDVNGNSIGDGTLELIRFGETANAVNEITITNAVANSNPIIEASGDDTNIDLRLDGKGSGVVNVVDGLTVGGDLTVNGTTTTVATTNTVVSDSVIELGNGTSGSPTNDAGIVIERGSANNAFIGFDESEDKFTMGTGTFTGASTGNLSITKGTLVADIESSKLIATNVNTSNTGTDVALQIGASTDWTVVVTSSDELVFRHNGDAKMLVTTGGHLKVSGDITAFSDLTSYDGA